MHWHRLTLPTAFHARTKWPSRTPRAILASRGERIRQRLVARGLALHQLVSHAEPNADAQRQRPRFAVPLSSSALRHPLVVLNRRFVAIGRLRSRSWGGERRVAGCTDRLDIPDRRGKTPLRCTHQRCAQRPSKVRGRGGNRRNCGKASARERARLDHAATASMLSRSGLLVLPEPRSCSPGWLPSPA